MTDGLRLFTATKGGMPFVVGHATKAELKALYKPLEAKEAIDLMESWAIVAINGAGNAATLHALGWRVYLGDVWITSALRGVNLADRVVRTSSGKVYALGGATSRELPRFFKEHLSYALRTWGFGDVRG